MISIFTWFTTPISTALGLVAPALLKRVGLTSDWDVLFDNVIFGQAMRIYIILGVVGLTLCTIPYIWYDLTKEKHAKCVAEIAAREAAAKETEVAAQ